MSQATDGARKTFIASETAQANLRWYISDPTTSPKTVSLCDASTQSIGVNEEPVLAASDRVTLLLANATGTRKMVAAGAITGGNQAFAAADGEVASSGTILEGIAFESVTTDQDILEVMGTFGEDVDEDWADNEVLEFGTGDDAILMWSTGDADNHTVVIGLGDTNEALHITDKAARATDWAVAADTHPTVYVHSNTTPATDYVKIGAHDGSACWLGDVAGAALAYVGFDGLECLQFNETASAVNHIGVTNAATGNMPKITCEGEADTGIILCNKDGEEILILDSIASSVNELTIKSAATGQFPQVCATGEADTGITFMNDQGEEILILDSIASSVNELTIKSAATGNKPQICATGEADNGIVFMNDQSEEILILQSAATSVNEITITSAATGLHPKIACTGEANTGITFQNSEAEEILILDSVASSVNEITIRSAATGNNPIIAATGEADSGIELHNDQAEELAIFECVATAVNEITFSNAATGNPPSISATGETNVGLKIAAKGTGTIDLYYAASEIASVQVTGLAIGTYVVASGTAGTNQLTLQSTGTAPAGTGANVGHLYADYENDDDELFWLSGTGGTATQLTT